MFFLPTTLLSISVLFTKLYNWIKYKTLPASYFFKNRLFIEREGRYKRILTNFGLVFRNSKWANYELNNIKLKFKLNYLYYLFFLLWGIIVLWFLTHISVLYSYSIIFNSVFYYIWLAVDTTVYYISFISWLLLITFSNFIKWCFSKWFMTNVNSYSDTQTTPTFSRELLNKNALFYTWFTNHSSDTVLKVNALERLFQTNTDLIKWAALADYFNLLYKVVFYTNTLNTDSAYKYNLTEKLTSIFFLQKDYTLLYLWQALSKPTPTFISNNYYGEGALFNWNLNSLVYELDNNKYNLNWTKSQFYLFNLSINKINTLTTKYNELLNLNQIISNQLNLAKQYRWLYKYSLIHRNLLINTINVTTVKKLLNSGFYSLNLFNKNLWGAEYLSNSAMPNHLINTYHNLLYYNLFSKTNTAYLTNNFWFDASNTISENLLSLRNYEESFFWFVKRDYFFKTLPAYKSFTKLFLNNTVNDNNTINRNVAVGQSYLLKAPLNQLAFTSNNIIPSVNKMKTLNNGNAFLNKDLFLLFNDTDFLHKTNVDLLNVLTINTFTGYYNYLYFNTLLTSTAHLSTNVFFTETVTGLHYYNYWFLLTMNPFIKYYFLDLYYFLLL